MEIRDTWPHEWIEWLPDKPDEKAADEIAAAIQAIANRHTILR